MNNFEKILKHKIKPSFSRTGLLLLLFLLLSLLFLLLLYIPAGPLVIFPGVS